MLQSGYSSNYTEWRSPWIYFSETVFAAIWGAELAKGEGPGRIYVVEPTGPFMDDPQCDQLNRYSTALIGGS
jgi:hypothetical protein